MCRREGEGEGNVGMLLRKGEGGGVSAGGMRTISNTYINSNKVEWRITIGRDGRIEQLRLQNRWQLIWRTADLRNSWLDNTVH